MSMISTSTRGMLALAALIGASTAASANGNTSGTVKLTGSVTLSCTVAVTDLSQSLNLVTGESSRQVGTVVETCNSGSGYTIALTSQNGGALKSSGSGNVPVNYSVSYDNTGGDLKNQLVVTRSTAQFNKSAPLAVTIQPNAQAIAGSYSDTVTITIAAK